MRGRLLFLQCLCVLHVQPAWVHRTALRKWSALNLAPHEPQRGVESGLGMDSATPVDVLVIGMGVAMVLLGKASPL